MSPQEWNRAALAHAPVSGAFLQSWQVGEFQRAAGREVRRYDHDDVVAQIVSRPLPNKLTEWDVFRSPFSDQLRTQIIADLKKTNGVFVHIEPSDPWTLVGVDNYQPL